MDYSYDPCSRINEIDFNNSDDLKKILTRDKHTRIEGIATEAVFILDKNIRSLGYRYFCKD